LLDSLLQEIHISEIKSKERGLDIRLVLELLPSKR